MTDYKWNNNEEMRTFWNPGDNVETIVNVTDKKLINRPDQAKFEHILRALCNVVSELVEIEESRSKHGL